MLFDTHAHYDDEAFDADRDAVLSAMPERNVGLIVNPGCTVESSAAAVALAERYPHVYAAVGIHPENCGDFVPEHMDAIRALAARGIPDMIRAEAGCLQYDYYLSIERADEILLLERWTSPQAQAAHLGQPHMAALREIKEQYVEKTALRKPGEVD